MKSKIKFIGLILSIILITIFSINALANKEKRKQII